MHVNCIASLIQESLFITFAEKLSGAFGRHRGSCRVWLAARRRYRFRLGKVNTPEKCRLLCRDLFLQDPFYQDLCCLFSPRCWRCCAQPLDLPPIRSICEFSPSTISTSTCTPPWAELRLPIPPTRPGRSCWKPAAPSIWQHWSSNSVRETRTPSLSPPEI